MEHSERFKHSEYPSVTVTVTTDAEGQLIFKVEGPIQSDCDAVAKEFESFLRRVEESH